MLHNKVSLLFVFAFFLIRGTHSLYDSDSDVKLLSDSTFNSFKKKHKRGVFLVEFYAPWCGHCKSMAPAYKAAAARMKGIMPLAAVDATENSELSQKFEVKGFPTLKLIKLGKTQDFNHRDEDSIVKALEEELDDDAITEISESNVDEFFALKEHKMVSLGRERPDSHLKIASMLQGHHLRFGFVPKGSSLEEKFGPSKKGGKRSLFFPKGKVEDLSAHSETGHTAEAIRSKLREVLGAKAEGIENELLPLHDESCVKEHCIFGGNLCVLFVEAGDREKVVERQAVLVDAKDELVDESYFKFVTIDGKKHQAYLESIFGQKTKFTFPRVFLVSYKKRLFSPFKQNFEKEGLVKFLEGFVRNEPTEKILKFQTTDMPRMGYFGPDKCNGTPPKKFRAAAEEKKKNVEKPSLVVSATAETFEQILTESKVPVVVEFYAPTCSSCKSFAPKFEKAAQRLNKSVLFVKVDASEEKSLKESFSVEDFPTVKLAKSPRDVKLPSAEAKEVSSPSGFEDYKESLTTLDIAKAAKKMLGEESLVVAAASETRADLAKSLDDGYKGYSVLFVSGREKEASIMDAISIFFRDSSEKIRVMNSKRLPENDNPISSDNKGVFVLKSLGKLKFELFEYKEGFNFPNLSKHLAVFVRGEEREMNEHFAFREIDFAAEKQSKPSEEEGEKESEKKEL